MKKLLTLMFAIVLVLAACDDGSSEQVSKEESSTTEKKATVSKSKDEDKVENEEAKKSDINSVSIEELKEKVEYSGIGEEDKLTELEVQNGEINATVDLANHELLTEEETAVSRYGSIAETVLKFNGWEKLTVKFVDVGTISMTANEKETNEIDMDYFPTTKIQEKLHSTN